jgi:hypothetical protein
MGAEVTLGYECGRRFGRHARSGDVSATGGHPRPSSIPSVTAMRHRLVTAAHTPPRAAPPGVVSWRQVPPLCLGRESAVVSGTSRTSPRTYAERGDFDTLCRLTVVSNGGKPSPVAQGQTTQGERW